MAKPAKIAQLSTFFLKFPGYIRPFASFLIFPDLPWLPWFYGNWYGPVILQPDWLIAGPNNTIWTTFFNFCKKIIHFPSFRCSALNIVKIWQNFCPVLFLENLAPYQTMYRSCKKVFFVWKMMIPYNQQFTNWVTRSVLEIRSPHFRARPSQPRAVRKR